MSQHSKELTILLVEDDDIDATSIQRSLNKQRVANTIMRAHDGAEALEFLQEKKVPRPFIILLDLQMPRMNGLEFLDSIREDPELTDSIVFILTTSKADRDLVESYNKHVAGYFVKDEVGTNFIDIVTVLESYWKIVHLPSRS